MEPCRAEEVAPLKPETGKKEEGAAGLLAVDESEKSAVDNYS